MGETGNLVDAVRRWFHRHAKKSSSSNNISTSSSSDGVSDQDQSAINTFVTSTRSLRGESDDLPVVGDFDYSDLKLVKVPKRRYTIPASSMDSHKKVPFAFIISHHIFSCQSVQCLIYYCPFWLLVEYI